STVWLDRGTTRRLDRGFGDFEDWRDRVLEDEEIAQHKLARKIAAEEHWMRYGVTARRKRNVRRVGELAALRQARTAALRAPGSVRLDAAEATGSGSVVVDARQLCKSYDGRPVVRDVSVRILRRDRIGIIGRNGTGKTTLIRLLTGALAPDAGEARLGVSLAMAILDQTRQDLDPDASLAEVLTGGNGDHLAVGDQMRHVISYMQDFLFAPEQARQPVRVLSGGERARLLLARALARPSNFLVLDEPTNDLDLETLDLLEDMLASYAGTVLVVSHDRDFLDRVVTATLVAEGDGRFTEYAGGYTDMLAQRGHGLIEHADTPSRPAKPAGARTRNPSAKLSFKDKHALATLPGEIAGLEKQISGLEHELADPGLYARDGERFAAVSAALATAQAKLAAAEERWLELEMRREELEG
ncbi:MAG: ATP-binding cassette domain-containing protein, partial [Alphaproteobacteria bacterium]|nr:ATP-binding cassette domain-containing protein [Alphaproteobacteria bacterium]